jgi:hypothetical protein
MHEVEKLRVLIPHWIEHNDEHAAEYRRWAEQAGQAGNDILAAVQALAQVNQSLSNALQKIGGPSSHHKHQH